MNENLARAALVWLDDWQHFFFKYFKIPKQMTDSLDVSDRRLLRINLQCKSFEWYLQNIWPDHFFPTNKRFFGKILLVQDDSMPYKNYLNILNAAGDATSSNWTYINDFLNSRISQFQEFYSQVPVFCLQQPQNRNSPKVLPYGRAWVGECNDKTFMDEMFVIREDGHVSDIINRIKKS